MSSSLSEIGNPAETYDRFLGPAVFTPMAHELLDRARLGAGERVVDVGCGTGIVTGQAARLAGADGRVTGIDMNSAMLAIARQKPTDPGAAPIDWIEANAQSIPLPDASADLVTCQQMLQFAPNRIAVLSEMSSPASTRRPLGDCGLHRYCRPSVSHRGR